MQVLSDENLQTIDIKLSSETLRQFLVDDARNRTESPPRHSEDLGSDNLVFTIGGNADVFGFRAYTFRSNLLRDHEDQIVVCWDRRSHGLLGLATGQLLGAWRTGLLGGIARQVVAPTTYGTCGVIGTGLQASTQAKATAALSPPDRFLVYSRNVERKEAFADELANHSGIPTSTAMSAKETAELSDVLIVATSAASPVIELEWLARCKHVTTVGPKSVTAHELPTTIESWADRIVSDSPQQILAHGASHFLASELTAERVHHVGDLISASGQSDCDTKSLYLSAGLAGTEVALLAALLRSSTVRA